LPSRIVPLPGMSSVVSSKLPGTVLIGNPGTGKSSMMNCFLQELAFKSGVSSNGVGVSFQLDIKESHGRRWMDTPGLSDVELRKAAAKAIDETLAMGGQYQILFVCLLDENRLREADITTMTLVFQAANQIEEDGYAIMFNKVNEKALKKLDMPAFMAKLATKLKNSGCPMTKHVHFNEFNNDMVAEDNFITKLPEKTVAFIRDIPEININNNVVQDVRAEEFDELMAANDALQQDVVDAQAAVVDAQAAAKKDIEAAEEEANRKVDEANQAADIKVEEANKAADEKIAQAAQDLFDAAEKKKADEEKAEKTALLKNGDRVRIRTGDFYLNKIPGGTYCATTGKEEGATFTVHKRKMDSGTGNGDVEGWSFEIDNMFTNDGYRFLYNATTGSAKYDTRANNSKQLFVTDTGNGVDIRLGTPTELLDVYTYSFLSDTNLSASSYSGGSGKYWVEGKKRQHAGLGHVCSTKWILEKVK